jgi:hypothetical protein
VSILKGRDSFSIILLIAAVFVIICIGSASGDTNVPAVPELQGIATGTSINTIGTVTETDSGSWSLTNDPLVYSYPASSFLMLAFEFNLWQAQLQAAGGSISGVNSGLIPGLPLVMVTGINVPQSLLNTPIIDDPSVTWQQVLDELVNEGSISGPVPKDNGLHQGVLNPGQVQYTTGYNDQYSGVSGQQTFKKSMAVATSNKISDQSNIKADTSIQFVAVDSGRATRSEDILLDGAAQATPGTTSIICPFEAQSSSIVPAFCNIEQAGSTIDTTLTSTVTSADTRFVGTDATIPVVLNYNINAEGLAIGNQSSPMLGSVSAYMKVHTQEARNESITSGMESLTVFNIHLADFNYSLPDGSDPQKSEDLVYSETSSASGLISRFSKSMSYSSKGATVQAPPSSLTINFGI